MARGTIFTAAVEQIAAGGAGITRLEGKCVFVDAAAPGDLLLCRITDERANWARAEILEIREPSPLRTAPVCRHYGICGGCSLQHLRYGAQLEAKTAILREAFTRIGGIVPPEIRVRPSPAFEYRNRVKFHTTENFRPGFKERKSSRVAALDDCPVADPGIRKALRSGRITPPPGRESVTVYSRDSLFLSEGGREQGRVSLLGRELAMDVTVFFQSNAVMLEVLIEDLAALAAGAGTGRPLADIYCGVGTFASFLGAPENSFPEIDLVEENKAALRLAGENMPKGKKVNYYPLSDTAWTKAQNGLQSGRRWGLMVLDPPREGLSEAMRDSLARGGPDLAAYVSCDPATLARDARRLVNGGYFLKELTLYDFYPHTAHIEALALFCRK